MWKSGCSVLQEPCLPFGLHPADFCLEGWLLVPRLVRVTVEDAGFTVTE
jgi:hypothetical protein